jgi:hypothetical protein
MSDGLKAAIRPSLLLLLLLVITGCAAQYQGISYSDPYGFFGGLLHGLVAPIVLLLKLFDWITNIIGVDVLGEIYAIGKPNTGLTYWIGFILGLSLWSGSSQ